MPKLVWPLTVPFWSRPPCVSFHTASSLLPHGMPLAWRRQTRFLPCRQPQPSIGPGCSDCASRNDSPNPIGVSPTCGSPKSCSHAVRHTRKCRPSSSSAVRAFPAATPIPTITCAAHWHAPHRNLQPPLFRRTLRFHAAGMRSSSTPPISLSRNPLCAPCVDPTQLCDSHTPLARSGLSQQFLMTPSLGPTRGQTPHRVRTPPADNNPVPNAAVSGCRSSPRSARWRSALPPDHGIPGGTLLHT